MIEFVVYVFIIIYCVWPLAASIVVLAKPRQRAGKQSFYQILQLSRLNGWDCIFFSRIESLEGSMLSVKSKMSRVGTTIPTPLPQKSKIPNSNREPRGHPNSSACMR